MPYQWVDIDEDAEMRTLITGGRQDTLQLPVVLLADGANTIRKWEVTGPNGPVSELLRILAMASDRYPILEMFNVFDRHDVPEKDRPARRHAFREQMRGDVRRRIG